MADEERRSESVAPQAPDPKDIGLDPRLVEDRIETVTVRRAPKVAVFLVLGGVVGLLTALVMTFAFGGLHAEFSQLSAMTYTKSEIFGYLALIFVAAGVALGGIVAVVLDATVGRRRRRMQVDRETIDSLD